MNEILKMLISIITAVLNKRDTIEDCIMSVQSQTYRNIEHIIVDGGSRDGTLEIIKKHQNNIAKVVSEPDNGIYDALNKGFKLATGDIIGFLHADDIYASETVLEKVIDVFIKYDVDSCYGDLLYVDKNNINKVIRYWKSSEFKEGSFKYGLHPPHPTFFVKKWVYDKYGGFNTDFKISSDYELMLRFLEKYKIKAYYIPEVLVKMRWGGKSNKSLKNIIYQTLEDYRAWKINGLGNNFFPVLLKKLRKIPQFLYKPKNSI